MELNDYQRAAARTVNAGLSGDERLMDAAAGLAEESGEVLAHVRKHLYMNHPLDRQQLIRELGDALWCLSAVAGSVGVTLEEVAVENVAKLERRYPQGYSDTASRAHND